MLATKTVAWGQLGAFAERAKNISLNELSKADPIRAQNWTLRVDGLSVDFSRTHLTREGRDLFLSLAREQELEAWREKMFGGEKINVTEGRAVLHTALRATTEAPLFVEGRDVIPEIRAVQAKMKAFVERVRSGAWRGATGQRIETIINIGIGGSDLGPRFVVSALRAMADGPRVRFVANVDAADILGALEGCDPATTLFVVVSKTFTTQETLLNAETARRWLTAALGETAVAHHFVAVSTNREAVSSFGIGTDNMFALWDWVGGRYSLWSAVGLSIALAIGWDGFSRLLAGAAAMDAHFRTAPLAENVPFLLGACGLFYRNFRKAQALAVLPYSERLRDLPRYLQQLDMESNGKSVTREGAAVDYATAPVIFGECGSMSQHSFHQWLHQGPDVIPAEFIGVSEDDLGQAEHHAVLRAHRQAQIEALKGGRQTGTPARDNAGNKPSILIELTRLDPENLGLLLALYEHKIFVQGILWGLNSFDQYGVELGKELAKKALES